MAVGVCERVACSSVQKKRWKIRAFVACEAKIVGSESMVRREVDRRVRAAEKGCMRETVGEGEKLSVLSTNAEN